MILVDYQKILYIHMNRVLLISLGCAKNLVDSERMLGLLIEEGLSVTSDPNLADVIVINTCGFLQDAVEEGVETILEYARYKEKGSCRAFIVTGCLVQRYGKKLVDLIPEVDCFLGTAHYDDVVMAVRDIFAEKLRSKIRISLPCIMTESFRRRVLSTPPSYAYLKIAEGCSHRCSYCYIPKIRGSLKSRTPDSVLEEVMFLDSQGIKELVLVAQDLCSYGQDWGSRGSLGKLLENIETITNNIQWIRLLYAHPNTLDDELIITCYRLEKVVPYLDIPIQHCVPSILKAMGRKGRALNPEKVIYRVRDLWPEVTIRTTIIVGFPGETEKEFNALVDFVQKMKFEHLGVFAFSPEKGTKAAQLTSDIPEEIKEERRRILYDVQTEISQSRLNKYKEKTLSVIVDEVHKDPSHFIVGRTPWQAPDVDGCVVITDGNANIGDFVRVQIYDAQEYDLIGKIVD